MRTLLLLTIYALLIGDALVAFVVATKMFLYRKLSRTFLYMGILFAGLAGHTGLLLAAIGEVPAPRPPGFRLYLLLALGIYAAGLWPVSLHILLLKAQPEEIPHGTLFIGDKRNHRVHSLSCPLLVGIPISSREYFALMEVAKDASYRTGPCCWTNGEG
jgi:hypothetical protein